MIYGLWSLKLDESIAGKNVRFIELNTKLMFKSWWTKYQVSVKAIYYFYFDRSRNVLFSLVAPSIGRQGRKQNPSYTITSNKNASRLPSAIRPVLQNKRGKKYSEYGTKMFLVRVSKKIYHTVSFFIPSFQSNDFNIYIT